jgi:hypothetical protein
MRIVVFFFLLAGILSGCAEEGLQDKPISFKQPHYFPPINFPEGNEPTLLRFELGRTKISLAHLVIDCLLPSPMEERFLPFMKMNSLGTHPPLQT